MKAVNLIIFCLLITFSNFASSKSVKVIEPAEWLTNDGWNPNICNGNMPVTLTEAESIYGCQAGDAPTLPTESYTSDVGPCTDIPHPPINQSKHNSGKWCKGSYRPDARSLCPKGKSLVRTRTVVTDERRWSCRLRTSRMRFTEATCGTNMAVVNKKCNSISFGLNVNRIEEALISSDEGYKTAAKVLRSWVQMANTKEIKSEYGSGFLRTIDVYRPYLKHNDTRTRLDFQLKLCINEQYLSSNWEQIGECLVKKFDTKPAGSVLTLTDMTTTLNTCGCNL